jgi:hypothetical protein
MNAKTYLDASKAFMRVFSNKSMKNAIERLELMNKFYSQSFNPSLITLFFDLREEGRIISNKYTPIYQSKGVGMIHLEENDGKWHYTGINGVFIATKPETLDGFISDCLRAGIDLKWLPPIEKQYFSPLIKK